MLSIFKKIVNANFHSLLVHIKCIFRQLEGSHNRPEDISISKEFSNALIKKGILSNYEESSIPARGDLVFYYQMFNSQNNLWEKKLVTAIFLELNYPNVRLLDDSGELTEMNLEIFLCDNARLKKSSQKASHP